MSNDSPSLQVGETQRAGRLASSEQGGGRAAEKLEVSNATDRGSASFDMPRLFEAPAPVDPSEVAVSPKWRELPAEGVQLGSGITLGGGWLDEAPGLAYDPDESALVRHTDAEGSLEPVDDLSEMLIADRWDFVRVALVGVIGFVLAFAFWAVVDLSSVWNVVLRALAGAASGSAGALVYAMCRSPLEVDDETSVSATVVAGSLALVTGAVSCLVAIALPEGLPWPIFMLLSVCGVGVVAAMSFRFNLLGMPAGAMREVGVDASRLTRAAVVLASLLLVVAQVQIGPLAPALAAMLAPLAAKALFGIEFRKFLLASSVFSAAVLAL